MSAAVFHAGALGDHVMIWPLVRALARRGEEVRVVAAPSHAALCEREVGAQVGPGRVIGESAERPGWARMWAGEAAPREAWCEGVRTVVTFVAQPGDEAGARWLAAARATFPGAERVVSVGRPDRDAAGRAALWAWAGVAERGGVEPRMNARGPVALYVGAGGAAKRWPRERWAALARGVRGSAALGRPRVLILAGANEMERGEGLDDLRTGADGDDGVAVEMCTDPLTLADRLRGARAYVGADTGPTHLAAQLGVPTLALFGPTDPAVWGPVGPLVRVVRSPDGTMAGLGVGPVLDELGAVVARAEGGAPGRDPG